MNLLFGSFYNVSWSYEVLATSLDCIDSASTERKFSAVPQWWLMEQSLCPDMYVCVKKVFLRWDGGGGHVSLCLLRWEYCQWQECWGQMRCQSVCCRCNILWEFEVWGGNARTHTHKQTHIQSGKTNTRNPPVLSLLSMCVWGDCQASSCATHHYLETHWYQLYDDWPHKKRATDLNPQTCQPPITICCVFPPTWIPVSIIPWFLGSCSYLHSMLWRSLPANVSRLLQINTMEPSMITLLLLRLPLLLIQQKDWDHAQNGLVPRDECVHSKHTAQNRDSRKNTRLKSGIIL